MNSRCARRTWTSGSTARRRTRCALCPDSIVIAADTLVALDGRALGKPKDDADAAAMLRALSDRAHDVVTGLCVTDTATGRRALCVERTRVRFRALTGREIDDYVGTGEPRDKAGAYAIQGAAGAFIDAIEGSYSNVVGLPLHAVAAMLRDVPED